MFKNYLPFYNKEIMYSLKGLKVVAKVVLIVQVDKDNATYS